MATPWSGATADASTGEYKVDIGERMLENIMGHTLVVYKDNMPVACGEIQASMFDQGEPDMPEPTPRPEPPPGPDMDDGPDLTDMLKQNSLVSKMTCAVMAPGFGNQF